MTTSIIRDFAYNPSDERFNGIYPSTKDEAKNVKDKLEDISQSILALDDDEEDDTDIDYSIWEWSWSFNNTKKKSNLSIPPSVQMKTFKLTVLSELTMQLKPHFKEVDIVINHGRTIFPFVKGTEYEMSLESPDEVLVITNKKSQSPSSDSNAERWSSIDENGCDEAEKKEITLLLEPGAQSFAHEIEQFLGFNQKYGDGWLTALKVKILGNWKLKKVRIQLIDLGLIPGNYCQLD